MRILYIFPHPDDESFGPAHVMHMQRRQGHEVYLLTLTKGGATRQRHKFGLDIGQMGEVRFGEMKDVFRVLGLSGMTVLDLPDSGMKFMDPRDIETAIKEEIGKVRPDVIVSYPVHGISGFHDHLVTHAAVKRVYCEIRNTPGSPKRLAFYTVNENAAKAQKFFRISFSTDEEIGCVVEVSEEDVKAAQAALDCYTTFRETIESTGIRDQIFRQASFELFGEEHPQKLKDLFQNINNTNQ